MSKAILVLDEMPDYCERCPAIQANDAGSPICGASNGRDCEWEWVDDTGCETRCHRANWCPLKEMPKKKAISGTQIIKEAHEKNIDPARYAGYCAGWNDCINSIGGDDNAD